MELIFSILLVFLFTSSSPIQNCKCKNIVLFGRVKVVESHADFRVKIVTSLPDLEVKKVDYNPHKCGQWRFVENHPDFTVKLVDFNEDFKIRIAE